MTHTIKNIFTITFVAFAMLCNSGCEKVDFGNINQDPNQTTEPITSALLTNALGNASGGGIAANVWDQGGIRTIAGYYAQYFSQTQYTEFSRYTRTTTNMDLFLAGVLNDLQMIIDYNTNDATKEQAAANGSNNNQIATARILKAYNVWWMTDLWGNIPYSQALKGNGSVPYDNQQDIYKDLIKELKEAVDQFDGGAVFKGDILFSGSITRWKKFANSLRLLMALQMSKVDATLGKAEFASALSHAAGVIEAVADNATIAFPGGAFDNIFHNYYNVVLRDDEAVSKTMTDWLGSRNDPRINAYGSSAVGFPYGLTRDNAVAFGNSNTNFARPVHPGLRTATSPLVILGAANIWLARAEAAFRGWTAENAATAYAKGIEESMKQWNVYSAPGLVTYLAQSSVDLASGSTLEKIANQAWAAWYPNGVQGWNLWRRTNFPTLSPAPGQANPIPRRITHGANEANLNPDNWSAGVAGYTVNGEKDSQWGRIWWDN
jgi:hypothetical protein